MGCSTHLSSRHNTPTTTAQSIAGGRHRRVLFTTMPARVCVVIGVGPGLGMSCVRHWAKEGYKVCLQNCVKLLQWFLSKGCDGE